jgi:hypothetical protein
MRRWFTLFPPQCFVSTWRWLILFPLLWKRRWFTLLPPQSLHGGDSHYSHLYEWGGDSHNSHLYERGGDSHYFHLNVYMEVIHITPTSMNEEVIHITPTSMSIWIWFTLLPPLNEEVIHITSTSMSTWRWFTLLPHLWMRRWFTLLSPQCLHGGDSHYSHLCEWGDSHYFHFNVYIEVIHITLTSMNKEVIHITSNSMSTWRWFTLLPLRRGDPITVKPAHAVTSIQQSPVLKGQIFLALS